MPADSTQSKLGIVAEEEVFALGYTLQAISELVGFVDTKQLTDKFSRTLNLLTVKILLRNTHILPEFLDKIRSEDCLLRCPLRFRLGILEPLQMAFYGIVKDLIRLIHLPKQSTWNKR